MRQPDYQREGVTLYCGDCLEILPQLGKVDAVVTDPPYGMNSTTANMSGNANCRWSLPTAKSAWPVGGNKWDDEPPAIVSKLPSMTIGGCIVWGGQFFSLPPSRGWLVWNKIIRNWQSSVC
jgi:site-specific DNA-methyltransferase (adenine-specific)